ncbi:bifunctional folylpolyglutamate synthase/dihydrofolate synthase [Gemella sp. GH3]|uniref:bifunctional folylpolyglutamate synthase/dihydrofolate synthase n=1 Tax=unclassified Gemella TaxID=2624949 RepID=UPI0015CFCC38|nr:MULTISPECIES: folylpolyglutamate synthase/dihydrofolate synthase family protein [unclassified Gemella]MBF0713350.1 bifunctional folylpolyglutamate synthase/dihydrofolate synthase [Gemella sp. GH3.1]NYS50302.1 bifunctional folylpolyglutamate synthase/dihydrofolate synthase [Gemella sp. GH3]
MNKVEIYKEKFAHCNNEYEKNIILETFNCGNLESLYNNLIKLPMTEAIKDILEEVCEDLIINSISKIERSSMKLGLHRMEAILELFDNPQNSLNVIHIAGTNGKGSVSSYITTTLSKKYRVGLYSSPGMVSFNDRIRIGNQYISYYDMYNLYKEVENLWQQNYPNSSNNLSFFEILTVVAINYFARNNVDFVVMEVGLGGRFDGTNVFSNKELSIITKIGLDHTDMLGDSVEKIAYEKAGIIQKSDNVVLYPNSYEINSVIEEVAHINNANVSILNNKNIVIKEINTKYSIFDFTNYKDIKIKMLGEHQVYNASLAILALEDLRSRERVELSNEEIRLGIEQTIWAGRLEWLGENILLDGAHNIDGVNSLINYIKNSGLKNVKLLLGILADKEYKQMAKIFESVSQDISIVPVPIDIKRSNVKELSSAFTANVKVFDNYEQGLSDVISNLKKDETLVVSGSLYLISAVRKKLLDKR